MFLFLFKFNLGTVFNSSLGTVYAAVAVQVSTMWDK